jgi:Peptidase family S51
MARFAWLSMAGGIVSSAHGFGQYLHMHDVLLLGPQFRAPNLRDALAHAGLQGPVVTITAGWQEREGELGALEEHLGLHARDLRLYERAEAVFGAAPALHDAYRARQNELRHLQDLYRLRLGHAKAAAQALMRSDDDSPFMRKARRSAIGALRRLDAEHLRDVRVVHARFEAQLAASKRPILATQQSEVASLVASAALVCIAGGHVAVLVNRLRLFGLDHALRGKPVAAWSAGAMAVSDRIVLFHDHPSQGAGNAELFEAGLGLVSAAVFLPHAATRLATDDPQRIALLARRFAPAACYTLDDGNYLLWRRGRLAAAAGSRRLSRSGRLAPAGGDS